MFIIDWLYPSSILERKFQNEGKNAFSKKTPAFKRNAKEMVKKAKKKPFSRVFLIVCLERRLFVTELDVLMLGGWKQKGVRRMFDFPWVVGILFLFLFFFFLFMWKNKGRGAGKYACCLSNSGE